MTRLLGPAATAAALLPFAPTAHTRRNWGDSTGGARLAATPGRLLDKLRHYSSSRDAEDLRACTPKHEPGQLIVLSEDSVDSFIGRLSLTRPSERIDHVPQGLRIKREGARARALLQEPQA
jgi:hypothetical protein